MKGIKKKIQQIIKFIKTKFYSVVGGQLANRLLFKSKYSKIGFKLRCLIFGLLETIKKDMQTRNEILKEIEDINKLLIPLLNSDKKNDTYTLELSEKRKLLKDKVDYISNNLFRYYVEFNSVIKKMNSDSTSVETYKKYHYSEIDVDYDSIKDGLEPTETTKKMLISEIFQTLVGFDLSQTTRLIIKRT